MHLIVYILGGTGLFLLGMWLMTDGLKLAAGDVLQFILRSATSSPLRGLLAGMAITAMVQSSSAVTVATIGFVNAGLLGLAQSVWVVFGANVGTTMTGWLVAGVGVKLDVGALALPLVGAGMILRLSARGRPGLLGLGEALAGFGVFFLGVGVLQEGFADLSMVSFVDLEDTGPLALPLFVGLGILLTTLTQSSSAAIAIVLTATVGGGFPLELAAAMVIGTSIGTTSTALFASIGATPPARRVAGAHVAFNVLTALAALLMLPILLGASRWLVGALHQEGDNTALMLAIFHTIYKCLGVALIWPLAPHLIAWLGRRFVSSQEEVGRPRHLDSTLVGVPVLALRSLALESARMSEIAFTLARGRVEHPDDTPRERQLAQEGLLRLGQEIRDYVGRLNAGSLPEDVAAAIPDIIRGVQHLEEVTAISGQVAAHPVGVGGEAAAAEIAQLRELVLETLRHDGRSPDDAPFDEAMDRLASDVEERYQRIKTMLLRAAAIGAIPVRAMETALLHVRLLRRLAEAARKARRRLRRWMVEVEARPPPADAVPTQAA
jgi:phosphate:Na+ symporter